MNILSMNTGTLKLEAVNIERSGNAQFGQSTIWTVTALTVNI